MSRIDAGGSAPRTLVNHPHQNFLTVPVDRRDLAQIDDPEAIAERIHTDECRLLAARPEASWLESQ